MKKICLTLILVAFGVISLSQTFYVHATRRGGLWIATGNWNSMIRTDGVSKNKAIVPQNMDNITGSSPRGLIALSLLPLNFTSFYITRFGENLQVAGSTDHKRNNSHFEVESSSDSVNWKKIGEVPGKGDNNNTNNYSLQ